MPFFSKVFRSKDGAAAKSKKHTDQGNGGALEPPKPRWEDAWGRKEVAPEVMQELIHQCTQELKSRALDTPFLLLPFRPGTDASSSRIFIGKFFKAQYEGNGYYSGLGLQQELRLTEPMVLCSIMKWCWSRLSGGVVTWDVYEMFKMGEQDSRMAAHSFDTFIPLAVDSPARQLIIFDFFDLLAAVAARGKTNGLGGRKLSRMAGWWAFEHSDQGNGFEGGYKSWQTAADAASHLFFAYLRSLSPENVAGASGISKLPRSLQSLLSQTEYPPERPTLMFTRTSKVVMIVDTVSPTPFALLRRARNFEYRDDDYTLAMYSQFEDPVKALTDECRRVLNAISSANQSALVMNGSAKAQDPSWSRFEDLGFSGLGDSNTPAPDTFGPQSQARAFGGMRGQGSSRTTDFGRPTTPSWADFLSTGFVQDVQAGGSTPMLLPPDKVLPPIGEGRGHSSQSHVRNGTGDHLEPGELASITTFELDDTFWWVWMTSLASEEPAERKAVFGRCALIETDITSGGGRWLVMEEQVKGASPGPEEGAYIAEKKSRFTFRRKGGLTRRKSTGKKPQQPPKESYDRTAAGTPNSRTTIGADQQAKIQAAAQELVQANEKSQPRAPNRTEDKAQSKTTSMLTIGTNIMNEASPAMQWAKQYDRGAIRAKYLGDTLAGTGRSMEHLATIPSASALTPEGNGSLTPRTPKLQRELSNRELPAIPKDDTGLSTPRAHQEAISPPPLPPSTPTNQGASAAPGSDEKKSKDRHPALRDYSFDSSKEMPLKPSPESPRTERTKLKKEQALKKKAKPEKKGDGGGLKKLFTKKGKENRMSRTIQPQPRKEEHLRAETPDSYAQAHVSEEPPAREPARAEPVLMPPEPQDDYQSDLSRVHTNEEREAAQAFNRFDQGPLNDVPAFVPTESPNPETEETAPTPPEFPRSRSQVPVSSPSRRPLPAESPIVSPVEPRAPRTDEVLSPTVAPPTDRWAQIRKNAAERAQRMSEDQSGPAPSASQKSAVPSSHGNTDDGDTSGEETIESRVARIKARVAELTGNMEQQGNARR